MKRQPLIIANWKMNPLALKEAEHIFNVVRKGVRGIKEVKIVICPPFLYLEKLSQHLKNTSLFSLGAQDCFWEEKGAYTGAVSPLMLKNLGCRYVIIGHSERRRHFQETDEIINKKIKAALKARLKPILCVGEEASDFFNDQGKVLKETSLVIGEQLQMGLQDVPASRVREVIIAYEPVWAIGTGNPCLPDDALKASLFLKKILVKLYGRSTAEKVPILYGGSVTSQNAADYLQEMGLDGLLVGGASLNGTEMVRIVKKVTHLFRNN